MKATQSLLIPLSPLSSLVLYASYATPSPSMRCCHRLLQGVSKIVIYDRSAESRPASDLVVAFGATAVSMDGRCTTAVRGVRLVRRCGRGSVGKSASQLIPFLSASYRTFYALLLFSTIIALTWLFFARHIQPAPAPEDGDGETEQTNVIAVQDGVAAEATPSGRRSKSFERAELVRLRGYGVWVMLLTDVVAVCMACGLSCVALLLPLIMEDSEAAEEINNVQIGWGFALTFVVTALSCLLTLAFERESMEKLGLEAAEGDVERREGTIRLQLEKEPLLGVGHVNSA